MVKRRAAMFSLDMAALRLTMAPEEQDASEHESHLFSRFSASLPSGRAIHGRVHSEMKTLERRPIEPSIDELITPALLLDLDKFEANLAQLTNTLRGRTCGFRPHAKTHKCPEIAKRQRAAGARGVSVATVGEAEAMITADIGGVLLTSPVVSPASIRRLIGLAGRAPDLMVTVDSAEGVAAYETALAGSGVTLNVLVDLDVGDQRTGIEPGPAAVALARQVADAELLRFRGLQAYSGGSSHTVGYQERRHHSQAAMGKAVQTRRQIEAAGLPVEILSGGSTGTYAIDSQIDGVTELQAGSFVFMDVQYRRIGGESGNLYTDFTPSLTVLSTVVSANHADHITIDAGVKAFSTETEFGPEPVNVPGVSYQSGGDEFGILRYESGARRFAVGERIRLVVPHCDPTVNLYDHIHCVRGDRVVDTWPILARRGV